MLIFTRIYTCFGCRGGSQPDGWTYGGRSRPTAPSAPPGPPAIPFQGQRFALPLDSDPKITLQHPGLVSKAHRLLYHSTLGLRVITKKKKVHLQSPARVSVSRFRCRANMAHIRQSRSDSFFYRNRGGGTWLLPSESKHENKRVCMCVCVCVTWLLPSESKHENQRRTAPGPDFSASAT